MYTTLIILALALVFFVDGRVRSDIVALCSLVLLMFFNILTPGEALSGFSNPIVIMMIGLFVVGGGIFKTGLAKMMGHRILELAGNSQARLFLLIMLVTAFIGAFVSNTGTVALMLPIVVSLSVSAKSDPGRFLMPLAFASSLGGMATLIGTPPNLVINGALIDAGYEGLSFFAFLPVGLICVVLGIIILGPLSKLFLARKNEKNRGNSHRRKTLADLVNEYQLSQNLFRVRVRFDSSHDEKKVLELNIPKGCNINILEIRRKHDTQNPFLKSFDQKLAAAETVIKANDILYVSGSFKHIHTFVKKNGFELIEPHEVEKLVPPLSENFRFDKIGIAEVVIMPNSKLVNLAVKDSGFREKFNVNILGIKRMNKYILQDLKNEKMHGGDSLLIQGEWNNIIRLDDDSADWVVVGQPLEAASKVTFDHKAPVAGIIMLFMVACMAFDLISAVNAVMTAAILMVLTGCIRSVEEAYKTINWESVVLIGAMLPVSIAIEKTGTTAIVANSLVSMLGSYSPIVLLAGIYFSTSLLTMFISNTATAVLFAPIALQAAIDTGVSPYPFLFAVTVAASMCFASPFSTPPNALVMSAGRYRFVDYIKVGLPLQVIIGIVMIFALPILFSF